jgi:hypothetical protein
MPSDTKVDGPERLKKRAPEPVALRVALMVDPESGSQRRALVAASASDATRLSAKGNRVGDLIFARITKPRSPGFHRLAHRIGSLAVENISELSHLDAHTALKRLQLESGAGCETLAVEMSTFWPKIVSWVSEHIGKPMGDMLALVVSEMKLSATTIPVMIPKSLSYDSMDEMEFREAIKTICRYMAMRYWPSMTAEEIEAIAETTQELSQ